MSIYYNNRDEGGKVVGDTGFEPVTSTMSR